jgi:hypothetical protein
VPNDTLLTDLGCGTDINGWVVVEGGRTTPMVLDEP